MRSLLVALLAATPVVAAAWDYPDTHRGDVVDDYHGTQVADPYRWLEDTDSEATADWVARQNAITDQVLAELDTREGFRERLTELWNYERFGVPTVNDDLLVYERNDGLQNQAVLYLQTGLDGKPRVLIDPNTLSADGTVALAGYALSPNGRFLAYALAESGSDWRSIRVRDVASGRDLLETLTDVKFSDIDWTRDSLGFFYSRYPSKDGTFDDLANQSLWYHRVGRLQSEDVQVYARPDKPERGFDAAVTRGGRYVAISTWRGAEEKNQLFRLDLGDGDTPNFDGPVTPVVEGFVARYDVIGSSEHTVYVFSTENAPRGQVIAINLAKPAKTHWRTVIPQGEETIESVEFAGGRLVVVSMRDAAHRMRVYSTAGKLEREIALPGLGTVGSVAGQADDSTLYYSYESFLRADTIYRTDLNTGKRAVWQSPDIDFNADDYVTEQVFYTSKDGTRVPMFITYKKGMKPTGDHRTLLYGYGGFNVSLTPYFRIHRLAWLERGGVFALANLRGGGEYGEAWHAAGTRENKQNVFDDFIAAGEYLVESGWTAPEHLAIQGGSNGGLLVGAVSNQRPDLFAAAQPAVGVMDMLRFHKFTIGWAWVPDYGSSDDAEGFDYLHAYSPLHNIKPGTDYPATLVTTADHDDRVVPGHSFKYIAALQHAHAGDDPVVIRIETKAGHGAGKPTSKRIAEAADVYAFLWRYTGD